MPAADEPASFWEEGLQGLHGPMVGPETEQPEAGTERKDEPWGGSWEDES